MSLYSQDLSAVKVYLRGEFTGPLVSVFPLKVRCPFPVYPDLAVDLIQFQRPDFVASASNTTKPFPLCATHPPFEELELDELELVEEELVVAVPPVMVPEEHIHLPPTGSQSFL